MPERKTPTHDRSPAPKENKKSQETQQVEIQALHSKTKSEKVCIYTYIAALCGSNVLTESTVLHFIDLSGHERWFPARSEIASGIIVFHVWVHSDLRKTDPMLSATRFFPGQKCSNSYMQGTGPSDQVCEMLPASTWANFLKARLDCNSISKPI